MAVVVFLFGLLTGSFLNVCIYRLPAGISVVFPPSHCPRCSHRVRWFDNIPVISYLFLGGRCRSCRGHIPARYPLVELLNGFLTLALFLRFGLSISFAALFLFCSALIVVSFIDFDHQIIPDEISLPGIAVGFLFSFFIPGHSWINSLSGIALGGGSLLLVAYSYYWLTGKEGMGGGDIKLLAMMGAFLGWRSIPFIVFASSLLGSIIGITIMTVRKRDARLAIPFGPYLALAAVLYVFYGRQLINWYLEFGRFGG